MSKTKFLKITSGLIVSVAALGSTLAYAQTMQGGSSGTSGSSMGSSSTGSSSTGGSTSSSSSSSMTNKTLNRADQKILQDLARADIAEIDMARIAQSKSQNPDVKNFAQRMLDDHTRSLQEVQQLAQAKGVMLPTEADASHKAMEKKLSNLSGDAFDRRYMSQDGMAEHREDHRMLKQAETRASDADVKALVAKTMPVIDQHMAMAQQTQAALAGAKTSTGTSGTSGTTGTSMPDNSASPGMQNNSSTPK